MLILTKYLGYGTGLDAWKSFFLSDGSGFGKNVIKSGVDMSSSGHVDNRKKDIVILGRVQSKG